MYIGNIGIMIYYKISLIFLLSFATFPLFGQRYVSGKITDADDGEPIQGVSVFFDNTTIGVDTDNDGYYQLRIPGVGSYRLTLSHVGYQSVFVDIEPGNASKVFNAAMQSNQLDELTVSVNVRVRQSDRNLFWRTILGTNPSNNKINVSNPEVAYFYYNADTRQLRVTCREPLQIINYRTGYHIQYVLEYFTHDYNSGISDWRNQSVFAELEPRNISQQNKWEKNRKALYDISFTKFIKSLYNNTLLDEGFLLADIQQDIYNSKQLSLSSFNLDEILFTNPVSRVKTLNLTNNMAMLVCYGNSINLGDIFHYSGLSQSALRFITNHPFNYDDSSSSSRLDRSIFESTWSPNSRTILRRRDLIRNMLSGTIDIYSDGTYTNALLVSRFENSASLMGLNMRLPIDYSPDSVIENAVVEDNRNIYFNVFQTFDTQLNVFPQEKIHVHTDRDFYVPGEKIWFKAYLADAATHQHNTLSRYVYVELIDRRDTLVSRVMIRPDENNLFHGHLFLSEIIPEGDYTLRAYTRYMENLDDDYFFKKNIRIGNLSSSNVQSEESDSIIDDFEDFEVSFYPEGGNLI